MPRLSVLPVLCLLGLHGTVRAQELVHELPDPSAVEVRTDTVGSSKLKVDLYYPTAAPSGPRPVVVFAFGFPDSTSPAGALREYSVSQSWARLLAGSGFVVVAPEARKPVADLVAVMDYLRREAAPLGVDAERIALWAVSGNVPVALKYARTGHAPSPAALVALYGAMPAPGADPTWLRDMAAEYGFVAPAYEEGERYPSSMPIYILRAGRDSWTRLLESIDEFVAFGLRNNLPLLVRNYPEGQHAFDVRDDTAASRRIIREIMAFLRLNLSAE